MFSNIQCDFIGSNYAGTVSIVLVISITLCTAKYRMEFKKRQTICGLFFWHAHRPALVVYLREDDAKMAGIPQCGALGTTL